MTHFIAIVLCFGLLFPAGADKGFAEENQAKNKAAHIVITQSSIENESAGHKAPAGWTFLVLETEWENIHPKQKVDKDKLERKVDRTMGVGGLGGGKKKDSEYVDVDVAYQIPNLLDHVYLLADGLAIALHQATEDIADGYGLQDRFTIAKQGEIQKLKLVYLAPEGVENLAFQLFDYQYGHLIAPVKGDVKKARGTGEPKGMIQGQAQTDMVEFASLGFNIQPEYMGTVAPPGWSYAVVLLGGKSLSGSNVMNIVQLKPEECTWVTTDGGYFYTWTESATAKNGFIRFTPEIYQLQELAFLIPESDQNFRLGIRVQNEVLNLALTKQNPAEMPQPIASHPDGEVMEILVFGTRQDQDNLIIDLGIRSLYEKGGIDIQMNQQFFLRIGEQEFSVDTAATASLLRHPPYPFVVPPGSSLRFELAFEARGTATALRYRGYESEGILKF